MRVYKYTLPAQISAEIEVPLGSHLLKVDFQKGRSRNDPSVGAPNTYVFTFSGVDVRTGEVRDDIKETAINDGEAMKLLEMKGFKNLTMTGSEGHLDGDDIDNNGAVSGLTLVLWAHVNDRNPKVKIPILIIPTGKWYDTAGYSYVGTAVGNEGGQELVFHVFAQTEGKVSVR